MSDAASGSVDRRRATLIGASALAMWSTLALLTTFTHGVPPFQLVAIAFAVAAVLLFAIALRRGEATARVFRRPWPVWLVGVGGLFGYHFFYFVALRLAPPGPANLVNYLWPLLIVLFSAALPGERLRWWHVAGALAGFVGTALAVGGGAPSVAPAHVAGYLAALAAAVIWAGYSVLSRRFAEVPTATVSGFCAATAVLSAACHLAFETTIWPTAGQWPVVVALGAGPLGLAMAAWDVGMKHGDIRVLGASAYLTPLFSTGLLVAAGRAEAHGTLLIAALLVAGGAALASREMICDPDH